MKISFGIIVLNGQPFTKYCLRQLYPFAHEIIVVEGGSKFNDDTITKDGHSTDGTLEALKEFKNNEDPENKLTIITKSGFWSEKTEQSEAYALKATGDYLWQVDIDEFYTKKDMESIIKVLEKDPTITGMSFKTITFFRDIKYRVDSSYLQSGPDLFYRLFKWGNGFKYVEHRPPTVINDKGENVVDINYIDGNQLFRKYGISLYHYTMLSPSQVKPKSKYHGIRGNYNWNDSFQKNYIKLTPFRFHNSYKYVSWLDRFSDEHPHEINNLIKDIKDRKIEFNIMDNTDIETLLNKKSYQIIRKYFIRYYGIIELFIHSTILKPFRILKRIISKFK